MFVYHQNFSNSITTDLLFVNTAKLLQEWSRDDHYPVCRLDIRQDCEFATGYGYPKTAFKREPDTDPDIRNAFIDIFRIQTFGNLCIAQSLIYYLQKHLFSLLCHDFHKNVCCASQYTFG